MDDVILVRWERGLFSSGWHVVGPERRHEFAFARKLLGSIPKELRDKDMLNRFSAAIDSDPRFVGWFREVSAEKGPVFHLRFPDGAWEIPWELLADRVESPRVRERLAFVRRVEKEAPEAPSIFEEPLRSALIVGAASSENGELELSRETEDILAAWRSLDAAVRQVVTEPRVLEASEHTLLDQLEQLRPHVITFSGHARAWPTTGVQFANGGFVRASRFAELIAGASGWRPVYVAFWACDTALPEHDEQRARLNGVPTLARALLARGVISVLAMQAPIRDPSALIMAKQLFMALVAGLPLERAVAQAREELRRLSPAGSHPLDWASPVIWSALDSVRSISWRVPALDLAQRQLLTHRLLESELVTTPGAPAATRELPSNGERTRARAWADSERTWVSGDPRDAANRIAWIRTLRALQIERLQMVIAVELEAGSPSEALQDWAETLRSRMVPGDMATPLAVAVRKIERRAESGWADLCAIPGLLLAVSSPPRVDSASWFWQPLMSDDPTIAHPTIVMVSNAAPPPVPAQWDFDDLTIDMDQQSLEAALAAAPRLARALAVLNLPLPSEVVLLPNHPGPRTLLAWQESGAVMALTPEGQVLSSTARRLVLDPDRSTAAEVAMAHYDAAVILGARTLPLTTGLRERRLDHLLGAFHPDATHGKPLNELQAQAAVEADALAAAYYAENRPRAVRSLARRLDGAHQALRDQLSHDTRLILAWAYIRLGDVVRAQYWLQRAHPSTPLARALRHGLLAEVYKSTAEPNGKQRALREVESAIKVCTAAIAQGNPTPVLLAAQRAYRQDRARILHFLFREHERAAEAYRELIKEWARIPEAHVDLAVVQRNYAECLRIIAKRTDNHHLRADARVMLNHAVSAARQHGTTPELAEILYEQARDVASNDVAATHHETESDILREAEDAAHASGHDMLLAIIQNRLFWRFEEFALARWHQIADKLMEFPRHGWAVRTLVDGRLQAARSFENAGDRARARHEVEAAAAALRAFSSVEYRGDRWRAAAVAVGLDRFGDIGGLRVGAWDAFLRQEWARDWHREHGTPIPEAIWEDWTSGAVRED